MALNDQRDGHFPSYELHRSQQVSNFEEESNVHGARQQNAVQLSDECVAAPALTIPSSKDEFTDVFYGNATLPQSSSSSSALQIDFPQFYPPQMDSFPDSALIMAIQQPQSGELPSLFSTNCYLPPRGHLELPTLTFRQEMEHPLPGGVTTLAEASLLHQQREMPETDLIQESRKLCRVDSCKSLARASGRCKRHGGSKRCSSPGCTKSVQSRGLCIRHGGGSRCQENGCDRASQSYGKCKMHGGGRPCIVTGCEKKAHLKRLCRKHGGGTKCSISSCEKWAQRKGMCVTHANTNNMAIKI